MTIDQLIAHSNTIHLLKYGEQPHRGTPIEDELSSWVSWGTIEQPQLPQDHAPRYLYWGDYSQPSINMERLTEELNDIAHQIANDHIAILESIAEDLIDNGGANGHHDGTRLQQEIDHWRDTGIVAKYIDNIQWQTLVAIKQERTRQAQHREATVTTP